MTKRDTFTVKSSFY